MNITKGELILPEAFYLIGNSRKFPYEIKKPSRLSREGSVIISYHVRNLSRSSAPGKCRAGNL